MQLIAERLAPRGQLPARPLRPARGRRPIRLRAVAALKREVNLRQGRFALRSAVTLPIASLYQDSANGYDICDVRGKECF